MAYEYQTGEDPIDLTSVKEVLPDELSGAYFQNLDAAMRRAEKLTMDRTLGDLGDRGFLRSGDTFTRVANDVLGPAQERRNAVLLPELRNAANQGREERLQGVQFDRTKELQHQDHLDRLDEIQAQAAIQERLLRLRDELDNNSGGFSWGSLAGQAAGSLAGGVFGGVGAGIGGGIGGKIGSSLWSGYGKGK